MRSKAVRSLTTAWGVNAAIIGCAVTVSGDGLGGIGCERAKKELRAAQARLSEATRSADIKAAAYQLCRERREAAACRKQHEALRAAVAAKRAARDAYRFALARKNNACV